MRSLVVFSLLLCIALSVNGNVLTSTDVTYHCFTRDNPTTSYVMTATAASVMLSPFSMQKKTVFTIHDVRETVQSNFNSFVVLSHLENEDVNVVAIDWGRGASTYTVGLSNAVICGQIIANFINLLITSFNYSPNQIRIVGHGMGGQMAGIVSSNSLAPVAEIVALDPPLVGWTHHSGKLKSSDATLVEVLHTTAGVRGYDRPCGDFDYYPNGGSAQPGCLADIDCSNAMSYVFYSESLNSEITGGSKFEAISCDSYEQASLNQCDGPYTATFGGTELKNSPPGVYYFSTNTAPPFAQTPRPE